MVSFHKITIGQQTEFNRVLAEAGFTKEDVEFFIKNPEAVQEMRDKFFGVKRIRVVRLSKVVYPGTFAPLFDSALVDPVETIQVTNVIKDKL